MAVRNAVGLLEIAAFAKYEITERRIRQRP